MPRPHAAPHQSHHNDPIALQPNLPPSPPPLSPAPQQGEYEVPLGRARVVKEGRDVTLISWGQQVLVAELAVSHCLVRPGAAGRGWRHA